MGKNKIVIDGIEYDDIARVPEDLLQFLPSTKPLSQVINYQTKIDTKFEINGNDYESVVVYCLGALAIRSWLCFYIFGQFLV